MSSAAFVASSDYNHEAVQKRTSVVFEVCEVSASVMLSLLFHLILVPQYPKCLGSANSRRLIQSSLLDKVKSDIKCENKMGFKICGEQFLFIKEH